MKKKTLISMLAALLALFVGLFCSSCFADLPASDSDSVSDSHETVSPIESPEESSEDSQSGEEHTHSLTKVEAVAATCLKEGNTEYYKCSCGKIFADENATQETTIEAVKTTGDHNYEAKAEQKATYYEEGRAAHYACTVCKKLFLEEDGEYVEKNASELVIVKKKIADETKPSVVDETSEDLINKAVADKVKQVDQTAPTFVKILNKDGVEVQAIYLSRSNAWVGDVADGNNNYSYSEFRIPVSGTILGISFEYKLVDFNDDDICNCSGLGANDKNLGMKSFLEYKHDNDYTNETGAEKGVRCFVADGEWHTFTFDHEMSGMQNILFKIHHFLGEFVVTNIKITTAHVHDLNKVDGREATCTEDGNKEYYICNECHKLYADAEATYELKAESVVIAKGHRYKLQAEKSATYYAEGVAAHYSCERCSKLFVKSGEEYTETTVEALAIAKKKLADETTASVRDTESDDLINEVVDAKVKQFDQKAATYVKIKNENGQEVQALYLSRTTAWDASQDNANNCGFIEFRVPASGLIGGIKFDYRIVDSNKERCTYLAESDKAYGAKSYIEYKDSSAYLNMSREEYGDECFVSDGNWHTFTFNCERGNMEYVLFKIYHLQGEIVMTNMSIIPHTHSYAEQTGRSATYFAEGVKLSYACTCGKLFVKSGDEYVETTAEDLVIPKKRIADETTASVVDETSEDLINKAVADKVKQVEQTAPTFVKILNKNGVEVQAIYLSRTAAWGENVANGDNNYSFSEFRIPVSGKIASISFEYKLVDFNPEDLCACSGLAAGDKNLGMKSFLEYKHDNDYTNETKATYGASCFVADGEWHTFSFDHEMSGMQNILFKIHHFQGEFVVTNIVVTLAHEHSYSDWNVTADATCERAGSRERVCDCGDVQVETIDALGHNYQSVDEVAATYYADGAEYHFTCDRCKKLFVQSGEEYVETTSEELKIAKKTLIEETTASVRNTESDDFINTIVDGKLKYLDQTPTTGTKFVTTADKNGDQVLAAYFSNSTAWSEADDRVDDGNNNWGFGEFRIALSGNITKISFEYRMWDVGNGVCQYFGPDTEPDKSYLMKHVIEYSDAAGYRNESKAVYGDRFLVADGEWHTFTLEATGTGMKNVLLKMYHFTGEMLVTNYKVGRNFLGECTEAERGTSADYINTIVDGKLKFLDQNSETGTKFVTTNDKNGTQVLAAYFSNSTAWSEAADRTDDGNNNWGFGEFRIALNGENITRISFEYKMWDFGNGVCQVADQTDKSYGMKHVIEYSDSTGYRNESKAVYGDRFLIADGEWHTFTLEATGTGMKNVLLKMYHFTGEMLVTNYTVTVA